MSKDVSTTTGGPPERGRRAESAANTQPGLPREPGRFHSRRKMEAVLRVLRGETIDQVSRELGVTAARLVEWRDEFLLGGELALRSRAADVAEEKVKLLHEKIGEITMENELLRERARRAEVIATPECAVTPVSNTDCPREDQGSLRPGARVESPLEFRSHSTSARPRREVGAAALLSDVRRPRAECRRAQLG